MKEARIGSVSWFAGVFWLIVSLVFQGLARVAFHTGEIRLFQRPAWWAAWKLIHAANRTNKLAYTCAIEAGAEEQGMRTSERLEAIANVLLRPLSETKRLQVNLPSGATLEAVEAAEHYIVKARLLLDEEAAILRKWND